MDQGDFFKPALAPDFRLIVNGHDVTDSMPLTMAILRRQRSAADAESMAAVITEKLGAI